LDRAEEDLPPQSIRQRPSGAAEPDRESASKLVLDVNDPQRVLLGEPAEFRVVIRNPLQVAAENVVVECHFGEGLAFAATPERALRQRLGTLGVGESRTLDLSLTAEEVGRHC